MKRKSELHNPWCSDSHIPIYIDRMFSFGERSFNGVVTSELLVTIIIKSTTVRVVEG